MIINDKTLLNLAPIKNMIPEKIKAYGVSHGLGEAGYDIRLKQNVIFYNDDGVYYIDIGDGETYCETFEGRFAIASAIEEFQMPDTLTGIVHDKSTWARQGLSVFNTVIEPGWKGFLTLELVYHGSGELHIPAGAGIAQVIFHRVVCPAQYDGKYQNQSNEPVPAIRQWDGRSSTLANEQHLGPVKIVDEKGVNLSVLDAAIESQRRYYQRDQQDPSQREFTPK